MPATNEREALPVGPAKTARVRSMFDTIAPRYDLLNRIMALGLDQWWRHRAVEALGVPAGVTVLDLACGTGDLSRACKRRGHHVIGLDFSLGMLSENHAGADMIQGDASALPIEDRSIDAVVCGYGLRNFTDAPRVLAEVARVLRPGGRLAILEIAVPPPGLLRLGYRIWFQRVVPVLGSLLSDSDAYHYLPRSTDYLPAPDELRAVLMRVGFSTVGHQFLQGGLSQLCTATRAGRPAVPTG